jgi:hypothetical protein
MRRFFVVLVLASVAVWACSESTDGLTPTDTGDGGSSGSSGSSSSTSSSSGSSGSGFDATTSSSSVVLINEISGGDEWIELVNAGSAEMDLGGWKVADRDKSTGEPKFSEAVTLPVGTKLAAGAYGMVRGGGLDGGKACPDGGQSFCFNAEFGISNKNGETIFLIASDGSVVGTVVYPADASSGDDSWSRIPSGDPKATFEVGKSTPGAPNQQK